MNLFFDVHFAFLPESQFSFFSEYGASVTARQVKDL